MKPASVRLLVIVNAASGLALLIAAVAMTAAMSSRPPVLLPADAGFGAGDGAMVRVPLGQVDLVLAVVVMLIFVSLLRFAASRPAARGSWLAAVEGDRHGLRWIELSQVGGISLFLIAQLNGVSEMPALVLLYAMAAAGPLLLVLHDRRIERGRRGMLAYSFGTAIASVPWGIVAFAQIGGGLAGASPSVGVRVLTIVMLILIAVVWAAAGVAARRPGTAADAPARAEVVQLLLLAVVPLALAVLCLALIVPA